MAKAESEARANDGYARSVRREIERFRHLYSICTGLWARQKWWKALREAEQALEEHINPDVKKKKRKTQFTVNLDTDFTLDDL